MKEKIFSYRDKEKMFMLKCINKVDFFKDLSDDSKHAVMYSMVPNFYYDDDCLIHRGEDATSLYFLATGSINVTTIVDN